MTHLTERDAIEHLCSDLVQRRPFQDGQPHQVADEESPLLQDREAASEELGEDDDAVLEPTGGGESFAKNYESLNALEIAAVSGAKKFLSQKAIQRIIDGMWRGDIMFWQTMSPHAVKRATVYHPKRFDPYTRLRVPLYLKIFEVLFFAAFLAFYYTVLVQRSLHAVTGTEVMLYVWLAAFAYNGTLRLPTRTSYAILTISTRACRAVRRRRDFLRRGLLGYLGFGHHCHGNVVLYLQDGRLEHR